LVLVMVEQRKPFEFFLKKTIAASFIQKHKNYKDKAKLKA